MNLAEHKVFVTGGTRGIGLELVRNLVASRASVALCGRSEEHLQRVRDELPTVSAFRWDLGEIDRLPFLVSQLREEFGSPTILVNNAAIQYNHSWLETETDERVKRVEEEVLINLTSPLVLTALLLEDLVGASSAAVVNISSSLRHKPKRSAPVYCATKSAIHNFTQGLRYQLEPHPHVKVIEVIPPLVDTGMTAGRGDGKLSPVQAAAEIVQGIERDLSEVFLGKARTLEILHRVSPSLVGRMLRDG